MQGTWLKTPERLLPLLHYAARANTSSLAKLSFASTLLVLTRPKRPSSTSLLRTNRTYLDPSENFWWSPGVLHPCLDHDSIRFNGWQLYLYQRYKILSSSFIERLRILLEIQVQSQSRRIHLDSYHYYHLYLQTFFTPNIVS